MIEETTGKCVPCMAGHQRTREAYAKVPIGVEVDGEPLRGDVRVCKTHYDQIRRALICASAEYEYPDDDPSATPRADSDAMTDGGRQASERRHCETCGSPMRVVPDSGIRTCLPCRRGEGDD